MLLKCYEVGSFTVNCYLIIDEIAKEGAIVDPGYPSDELLYAIQKTYADISFRKIFLTHGHFDHIGGVNKLQKLTDAEVFIHTDDAKLMQDGYANLSQYFGMPEVTVSNWNVLSEESAFSVGSIPVTVWHTPGHSAGSVCYLLGKDTLLSGDTLFHCGIGRTDFPGSSPELLRQSLRRLAEFPENLKVYPGHGEATDLQTELKNNPWLL